MQNISDEELQLELDRRRKEQIEKEKAAQDLQIKFDQEMYELYQQNSAKFDKEFKTLKLEYDSFIKKVEALSEQYGIPCEWGDQGCYNPKSIETIYSNWKGIEDELMGNGELGQWWYPSQICY